MLPALRILYWLGVRTVYLVGADFQMTTEQTYAFDQRKDAVACSYNNDSYSVLAEWFRQLRPHFAEHGFEVLNATVGGCLESFERIDFCEAIERASLPPVGSVSAHYQRGRQ